MQRSIGLYRIDDATNPIGGVYLASRLASASGLFSVIPACEVVKKWDWLRT